MNEPKIPKPESLEAKFRLLTLAPLDKRMKRKHLAVYGFILDWFHSKYGDALASVRHVADKLKERDPVGVGLYLGDVHAALTDLVAWGYLSQELGKGRRASRYVPIWEKACSVHKTPNATDDEPSVRENQNTSVRETPNTTADSVHKTPNEDPPTGPGHKTRGHVVGDIFEAAPVAPPTAGLSAAAAGPASGDGFDEFWKAWPRKHGIKKARAEWKKILSDVDIVIEVAGDWARHYEKHGTDKKWIPEPANWLAGERWLEDLPLIHDDAKGAAIAKSKANAKPKTKPEPVYENDNTPGPLVMDVGPFTPFGTFHATIEDARVEELDRQTQKVVLDLSWGAPGWDAQHTLYYVHPDPKIQQRGRDFIAILGECIGEEITDTNQLVGKAVQCIVNNKLAISYRKAA